MSTTMMSATAMPAMTRPEDPGPLSAAGLVAGDGTALVGSGEGCALLVVGSGLGAGVGLLLELVGVGVGLAAA